MSLQEHHHFPHSPSEGERAAGPGTEEGSANNQLKNPGHLSDARDFQDNKLDPEIQAPRSRINREHRSKKIDEMSEDELVAFLGPNDPTVRKHRKALEKEKTPKFSRRTKILAGLAAVTAALGIGAGVSGIGGGSEQPGAKPRPTATANLEPTPEVPSYMTVERLAYPDVDHLAVDSFESYEDVFAKFKDLERYGLNKEPEIFHKFMEPSCKLLTLDSSLNEDLNEDRIISDHGEGSDEDRIRRSGIMLEPNYIEPHFITQKYGVEWEELGYDKSTWFAVIAKRNVIDIENGETKKVHDYDELKFLFVKREEPETGEQRWYLSEFGWPNEHDYEAAGLEPPKHAPGIDGSPEAP